MKRLFCLLIICLLVISCSKKEVKKETEEGRIASEIISISERLREAYVKRDLDKIQQYTMPQVYRQVVRYIDEYKVVELEFKPVWVEIENKGITLNISWKGKWVKSGRDIEDRGMAIFEFAGQPLKVSKITRANPFEYR